MRGSRWFLVRFGEARAAVLNRRSLSLRQRRVALGQRDVHVRLEDADGFREAYEFALPYRLAVTGFAGRSTRRVGSGYTDVRFHVVLQSRPRASGGEPITGGPVACGTTSMPQGRCAPSPSIDRSGTFGSAGGIHG